MRKVIVKRKRARMEVRPFGNPKNVPGYVRKDDVPESEDVRVLRYVRLLREERDGETKKGTASEFRKKYLANLPSHVLIKKAKEAKIKYEEEEAERLMEPPEYKVIEYGKKDITIPEGLSKVASEVRYGDPFSYIGESARPTGVRIKKDIMHKPLPVGPVQKALFVASREYSFYRNQYEDEKDKGHIHNETEKRLQLYMMLKRELTNLLNLLNAETRESFIRGATKQQKAKRGNTEMLYRAMRMVTG